VKIGVGNLGFQPVRAGQFRFARTNEGAPPAPLTFSPVLGLSLHRAAVLSIGPAHKEISAILGAGDDWNTIIVSQLARFFGPGWYCKKGQQQDKGNTHLKFFRQTCLKKREIRAVLKSLSSIFIEQFQKAPNARRGGCSASGMGFQREDL